MNNILIRNLRYLFTGVWLLRSFAQTSSWT